MNRKALLTSFLAVLFSASAFAQMSEDRIIQYVKEQTEKGVSQEQIVYNLQKRGVTPQQLQQMQQKYNQQKATGVLGNTLQTEQSVVRNRTQIDRSQYQSKTLNMVQSEDEKYLYQNSNEQERLQMMYDQSMFLFTDSLYLLMESLKPKKEIFGHNLFNSPDLNYEPSGNLATPRNYHLGPGDEVIIDVWGASQTTIQQTISPDGNIVVENLGPVYLNGMTVTEADAHLKKVFSQIYSVGDEESASQIKLSLGQNRSIQVNVMGEVMRPGTYMLSSFATVFNAMYMAGGVSEVGTLRDVKVFRNNKEIASVDIYDYILNGMMSSDIRLEDNDVIMVNAYDCLVTIDGRVKRPMFYEMKPTETVAQLVKYAGGLASDAYKKDLRLTRMGDVQRELYTLTTAQQNSFNVQDGDSIYVDSIQVTYSNMVEVRGAVYRPGQFQIGQDINTVKDLVIAAGGLKEDAFMNRALLNRTNQDKTLTNKTIDLKGLMDGSFADEPLRNNDVLFIPSLFDVQEVKTFSIFGEVQFPGTYQYADNTQIEDLILQAGGLLETASTSKVDVVRRARDKNSLLKAQQISETFSFSISDGLLVSDNDFVLSPFDEVYIRKSPGYSKNKRIQVQGEVMFPGYYSMDNDNERLSDIINRSGMFTEQAYPAGARLERTMTDEEKLKLKDITKLLSANDSTLMENVDLTTTYYVGINLQKAMENPGSDDDIVLRNGDRIIVPEFTNTVKMNGEVMYSNTVPFIKGKSMKYYIDKAGGFSQTAKRSKAYVVYMNGSVSKARRTSRNLVQPGCEIIVPAKSERDGMTPQEVLSLSSTSASLATVVLALINLLK